MSLSVDHGCCRPAAVALTRATVRACAFSTIITTMMTTTITGGRFGMG